jgi:hypothetical protein
MFRSRRCVLLAAVMLVSACSPHGGDLPGTSSAGPSWVVCGTTLTATAAAPSVTDVSAVNGPVTVRSLTTGGIDLLLAKTCDKGAQVSIQPPAAGTLVKAAHATDGSIAAVVIAPHQGRFLIRVQRGDGRVVLVDVDLQDEIPEPPRPS